MSPFLPTPEQERALTAPVPLLVIAGAGTGKTTVLTRRIAETIVSGQARPDEVLALTFTEKAATEMAERLGQVLAESGLGEAAYTATVGTFHSFGGSVIRENFLKLGFERVPAVLTRPAAWQLLTAIFDELTFDAIELSTGQPGTIFDHLLHLFGQCQDHLVRPDDLERYAAALPADGTVPVLAESFGGRRGELLDAVRAYRRYEAAKRERSVSDFGDHLSLPVHLLQEHPAVRDGYRRRYRFLFVDEYQDTNHAQRQLLLELLDPARPQIMVIGDDDQAIYRWRGAVVQNILHFPEESIFKPDQVQKVKIIQNRRSFPPILDLANLVISEVADRHEKELGYHPDNGKGQARIGHYLAASDRDEGEWIAAKIQELRPLAEDFPGKKHGYGAFAILCRKRSLFAPIGQALENAGIPYELIGGTGFYDRWEIRDIISYLRLLVDPAADLALARILGSRRWRLASRELYHLGQWVQRQNGDLGRDAAAVSPAARLHLLDAVLQYEAVEGLSAVARKRLDALREELRGYIQDQVTVPLAEFVTHLIEKTGYREELRAQGGFDARVALLNLEKLEGMARGFAGEDTGGSLAAFVEFVLFALDSGEDEGEVRPIDEESDTVKVMTVHQAKGLEFPIVFSPGLAERIFPSPGRDESDKWYELPGDLRGDRAYLPKLALGEVRNERELKKALEARKVAEKALRLDEERRLFYVAITRAQSHLYLTRSHWYGTNLKPREASPFWEMVANSPYSASLGEEACPATNPNWGGDPAADPETEGLMNDERSLESLLLSGENPSAWIEATAQREGYGRWTVLQAAVDAHLNDLVATLAPPRERQRVSLSCSTLLLYWSCPRLYQYIFVDRLPRRPSPSARIGQEVHRRIEELSRPTSERHEGVGHPELPDEEDAVPGQEHLEDLPDLTLAARPPTERVEPRTVEDLVGCFRHSTYGQRQATYVEMPFRLALEGGELVGRIDRIDRLPDGTWEIVDFKSGIPAVEAKTAYRQQLALYALAVREIWQVPPAKISAHLFFLRDGSDLAFTFETADLDSVRKDTDVAMRAIAQGEMPRAAEPTRCEHCDYSHLCQSVLSQ